MRLLSFLSEIQDVLSQHGIAAMERAPQRSVDFRKGLARMVFFGGQGSLLLQSFVLADGRECVKAALYWPDCQRAGEASIYPRGDEFDWAAAAKKVALQWMGGPPPSYMSPPAAVASAVTSAASEDADDQSDADALLASISAQAG